MKVLQMVAAGVDYARPEPYRRLVVTNRRAVVFCLRTKSARCELYLRFVATNLRAAGCASGSAPAPAPAPGGPCAASALPQAPGARLFVADLAVWVFIFTPQVLHLSVTHLGGGRRLPG